MTKILVHPDVFIHQIDFHLIPFLSLLYLLSFLVRAARCLTTGPGSLADPDPALLGNPSPSPNQDRTSIGSELHGPF